MLWLVTIAGATATSAGRREYLFDMGRSNSVVRPGWTQITENTVYSPTTGYGWEHAAAGSFDDPVPVPDSFKATHPHWSGPVHNDVLRDGVEDERPLRFQADVPPGRYWVSVHLGRYTVARHDLGVWVNGKPMGTNIDAWGPVWGSHGGTPTRVVAAIVDAPEGRIDFRFETAAEIPDRWRDYTDKRPENGRLWFLGSNRNSVLGIRIRPHVEPRLTPIPTTSVPGGYERWDGTLGTPSLQVAVREFNRGELQRVQETARSFVPASLEARIDHASLLETLAGSMVIEDRGSEWDWVRQAELQWRSVLDHESGQAGSAGFPSDRYWLALARHEACWRHRQALEYVAQYAYSRAQAQTGLRNYDRYWAAYDLEGALTRGDPLEWKGRLLRGRIAHWNWAEGHHRNTRLLADQEFAMLQEAFPNHPLVRLYTGATVRSRFVYRCPAPEAPAWARLQHEALSRYSDLIHYWVQKRQDERGELGGGWGDDVEILRGWVPAVLALDDPIARGGLRRLAEGLWNSGVMTNGYCRDINDVEHGAEPMSDTHPLLALVQYGDPTYLERCLQTMACLRDVWTAPTRPGRRLFRSHHFSATAVSERPDHGADVALNGRAANPGLIPLWYSNHPEVERLLGEWVGSWIDAAFQEDRGKPIGFVPGSIRFPDGRPGGHAEQWWQTRDYFADFESVDYTATLYHHMVGLSAATGDDSWMRSLRATTEAVEEQHRHPRNSTTAGTEAWAAQVSDSESLADVLSKWRLVTGRMDFDPFLSRRGSAYQRYLIQRDETELTRELEGIVTALSSNIEMSTTEVLFTDRVSLPGNEVLFEMLTGSLGTPTYWPLHAVTWEGTAGDLAALVEEASPTVLRVRVFSFAPHPITIEARLWRLEPGDYTVRQKSGQRLSGSMRFQHRERGAGWPVRIAPRTPIELEFRQVERGRSPARHRPDPALGSDALEMNPPFVLGKPVRIRARVHNIGSAATGPIQGRLLIDEREVMSIEWPSLEAPLDLRARESVREFEWTPKSPGEHRLRLEIVPGTTEEITRGNNSRTLSVSVSLGEGR